MRDEDRAVEKAERTLGDRNPADDGLELFEDDEDLFEPRIDEGDDWLVDEHMADWLAANR